MMSVRISSIELDGGTRAQIGLVALRDCWKHPVYEFITPTGQFYAECPLMPVLSFCEHCLGQLIRQEKMPINGAN